MQSAYHAGPKMGVGRFQLGFFKVLYLHLGASFADYLRHPTSLVCMHRAFIKPRTSDKDAHQTRTLSAVVAETIEPATSGIARAIACRSTGQQCSQTHPMSFKCT